MGCFEVQCLIVDHFDKVLCMTIFVHFWAQLKQKELNSNHFSHLCPFPPMAASLTEPPLRLKFAPAVAANPLRTLFPVGERPDVP